MDGKVETAGDESKKSKHFEWLGTLLE